jgi:hypothetical protein
MVTENVPCARIVEHVVATKEMREHILYHHSEEAQLFLGLLIGHLSWTSEYWRAFKE